MCIAHDVLYQLFFCTSGVLLENLLLLFCSLLFRCVTAGEFQRKSAPLQSDIAPDANHWRSNSDNFAGAAGLQSLGGHIWNPSEAFAMSRTGEGH